MIFMYSNDETCSQLYAAKWKWENTILVIPFLEKHPDGKASAERIPPVHCLL